MKILETLFWILMIVVALVLVFIFGSAEKTRSPISDPHSQVIGHVYPHDFIGPLEQNDVRQNQN